MMKTQKEIALIACSIIGGVADFLAIAITLKTLNIVATVFIATIILFIVTILYLYIKYKQRCEFLSFIQYLFDNPIHKFNILPKICLLLNKTKETNDIYVRNMSVNYTYDMSNINLEAIDENTQIQYLDTIEYCFQAENKKIPEEFVCYLGNMYEKNGFGEISQKHGVQKEYVAVPPPRYTDETRPDSVVQRYSWQLIRENFTKDILVPISFQLKCLETTKANCNDTIIIYPRQYAKKIEQIDFGITFLCNKKILKKVEVFKIQKDRNSFKHIPVSSIPASNNTAKIKIKLDSTKYEAYYFRVYWELK